MTDQRRVEVAAEADAAHLMWRGEPQHKPTRWTCSGCGTVVTSPAERDASRTAHAALVADLRALCDQHIGAPCDCNAIAHSVRALLDRHAPEEGS